MGVRTHVPLMHVRCLWRPEQFNRCTNPSFATNTTGWSVSAGINAAGTVLSRITSGGHSTQYGQLTTGTSDGGGANFDFGSERFFSSADVGVVYTVLVWLKSISSAADTPLARIILGSEGTAADRAEVMVELSRDAWRPYLLRWLPTANRTDVQLAITNASADANVIGIDDVAVYTEDSFSQCENANFIVDTTGWDTGAGNIAGSATSLTRITSDAMYVSPSSVPAARTAAELVTTATSGSGADFPLGNRLFTQGRTYRLRVAMKSVSGTTTARLRLGSIGTGADRGDTTTTTITTSWAMYSVDWTPSADRTDACLAISNGTASVMTARIGHVEVYEALDDISAPYLEGAGWGRQAGQRVPVGSINLVLNDSARRFDPDYASSPLHGYLEAGRPIWGRCTYSGSLYPLFYGRLTNIEPRPLDLQVDLFAEEVWSDMVGLTRLPSNGSDSVAYYAARNTALSDHDFTSYQRAWTDSGPEGNKFLATTDEVGLLDFLENLNEATGSSHHIRPDARAEVRWRWWMIARSDAADSTDSDETITDADIVTLEGYQHNGTVRMSRQFVPWQGYEQLLYYNYVAVAVDASIYGYIPERQDGYLRFTDDRFGSDDDIPEPIVEERLRRRRKGKKKRAKKITTVIFPDQFVPFTMQAGETKVVDLDFAIAMDGGTVTLDDNTDSTNPEANIDQTIEMTSRHATITLHARDDVTVDFLGFAGTPYLPLDEAVEDVYDAEKILKIGDRVGPTINTPFIVSRGMAEGLGRYLIWRYGTSRKRFDIVLDTLFPSMVQRELVDHITVTADRWNLAALVTELQGISTEVSDGGLRWVTKFTVEELPVAAADYFTLGTSALGGTDVLAY